MGTCFFCIFQRFMSFVAHMWPWKSGLVYRFGSLRTFATWVAQSSYESADLRYTPEN